MQRLLLATAVYSSHLYSGIVVKSRASTYIGRKWEEGLNCGEEKSPRQGRSVESDACKQPRVKVWTSHAQTVPRVIYALCGSTGNPCNFSTRSQLSRRHACTFPSKSFAAERSLATTDWSFGPFFRTGMAGKSFHIISSRRRKLTGISAHAACLSKRSVSSRGAVPLSLSCPTSLGSPLRP